MSVELRTAKEEMEKLRGDVESSKSHMLQVIAEFALLVWYSSSLATDVVDYLTVQEYSPGERNCFKANGISPWELQTWGIGDCP